MECTSAYIYIYIYKNGGLAPGTHLYQGLPHGRSDQDLGTRILVPASWYQDPDTKIPVPRSTESPSGGASRDARGHGGLQAPARGSGGLEAPQEERGSGGRQPPSKNNFMDPGYDIFCSKKMKFGPKLVHMARYELILKLVRALWLRMILKPLLTPKRAMK